MNKPFTFAQRNHIQSKSAPLVSEMDRCLLPYISNSIQNNPKARFEIPERLTCFLTNEILSPGVMTYPAGFFTYWNNSTLQWVDIREPLSNIVQTIRYHLNYPIPLVSEIIEISQYPGNLKYDVRGRIILNVASVLNRYVRICKQEWDPIQSANSLSKKISEHYKARDAEWEEIQDLIDRALENDEYKTPELTEESVNKDLTQEKSKNNGEDFHLTSACFTGPLRYPSHNTTAGQLRSY